MKNKRIFYQDIGRQDYHKAFALQTDLFERLKQIKIQNKYLQQPIQTENYFLFTEHPHIYTLGKSGKSEHLLLNEKELNQRKIQFIHTNRGGDITYHGPGQIVGYPIIDLDNFDLEILSYMRKLEQVIIDVLSIYDIKGERIDGQTGVWIDAETPFARKICAMGVKTSRWITMHGFALNVDTDLSYFSHIIPCGIHNKGVTSMQKELGYSPDKTILKKQILQAFEKNFGARFLAKNLA